MTNLWHRLIEEASTITVVIPPTQEITEDFTPRLMPKAPRLEEDIVVCIKSALKNMRQVQGKGQAHNDRYPNGDFPTRNYAGALRQRLTRPIGICRDEYPLQTTSARHLLNPLSHPVFSLAHMGR